MSMGATVATAERESIEVQRLERDLLEEFGRVLPAEEIRRCVREAVALWHGARVRQYIPILAERAARQRLLDAVRRVA
jgi:hypothetical protein